MATQMAITGKTVADVIQITPFGFVCNVCGRNVPDSHRSFQRHMQGHKIAVTKSGFSSCVKTLCDMQRNVRNRWDIVALYLTGETKKGFSCNCIVGFQYRHVAQHHVDDNHCGATKVVEEDLHMTTSGQAVSLRAFKVHIHGCSDTTGLRMKNNHASKNFRNIDSTSTESQTKQDQIAPFLRSDEKTHIRAYYDVVHSFISLLDPSVCFQDAMTECVKRWNAPVEESEKSIAVASALCNDWLSNHAWLHVSRTPGNIRAALLVFDATSILDASQNSTFCFRMNTSIVLREAEKLFRYILRLQNDEFVKQLLERECLKPSPNWRIVPKCLRELLLQEGASYAKDTMIVNYCVSRLYRHDGVSLIMSGAGKSANVFGDVLFLMRTAVCSCLYEEDVNGGYEHAEEVIRSVRCSRALNTIAPMIRRLREIENTKPNKYKSTVGTNGDIMVQAFVFRRDIVRRLVPTVVEKCVSLFQQMLVGLQWLSIIDMSQPITVVQDVDGWFTFCTGDGDDCVQSTEMDITNLDDGESCLMSCMGLVDMMFHGFGGGPMRFQELQRMETTDLVWHDNTIYYTCTTKKKFSCLGTGQRVTERKLPHVASRIFLIHQAIVALLNAKGRQICKPFGIDSTHMQDAVSCVFGLRDTPTCLDCRHLWSAVSNIVTNQNNSVEFLSATEESATLAGHSHLTHISRYATGMDIGKEYMFKRYHEFIGCDTMVQQNVECTLPTLDCVDLQCALELIHGRGCDFLSNTQRELVNAIGCSNDHVAAIMNCGAGKSMSWILPILAARSFGRKFGSIMVVLPYRFLTAYHFFSTQQLLESYPNITMTTIVGSDVTERMIPYFMDSCSRLPDIIFTTIDAFASLSRYHEGTLSRLSGKGAIARLIFDEAHTMCTELFRSPYEQLRDVGKYHLPVAIMSGSLTESITSGLLSYMGLLTGECNIHKSKEFFGCIGEYISINVTTTTGPTAMTTTKTMKILKSFPTHCVHIIVGTKDMGETLLSQIKGDFEIALLTSVTSEKDQKEISNQWRDGQLRVLISTTCGLCGNENKRCHHVLICGMVYSLTNIVQSFGRLRPSQRISGSLFDVIMCVVDDKCRDGYVQNDDVKRNILVTKGLLSCDNSHRAMTVLGNMGVAEWVTNHHVCRLVSLAKCFERTTRTCSRCDVCRKPNNNLCSTQLATSQSLDHDRWNENRSIEVLKHLGMMCLVCRSASCDGESCLPSASCFICAGRHRRSDCKTQLAHIFQGRGCQYCYDLFDRRGFTSHDATRCPLQRRLRRCVQDCASQAVGQTYQQFVIKNFSETRMFYGFLCMCSSKYMSRQNRLSEHLSTAGATNVKRQKVGAGKGICVALDSTLMTKASASSKRITNPYIKESKCLEDATNKL